MIICVLYALIALIVLLIVVALVEWGIGLAGLAIPANVIMLFRVLIAILWLIYVIGCFMPFMSGGFSMYPRHPGPY